MNIKRFVLPVIASLLMTGACSFPVLEDASRQGGLTHKRVVFTAESGEPQTKTAFQNDETSIWWSPGDEIAIFYGASGGSKFTATNDVEVAKAEFQGELDTFTGESESGDFNYFWAVYPYTAAVSSDGQSVVATLSDHQTAKAGSFSPNTNISIAKSPGLALSFFNACSWFRFTVNKEGVKRVIFQGNNNEDVAGEFRVSMGEDNRPTAPVVIDGKKEIVLEYPDHSSFEVGKMYYITLLPQVFSKGFTVIFQTETEAGARSITSRAIYARSKYNTGVEFDKKVEYVQQQCDIGDIVYSDGWGVVFAIADEGKTLWIVSVNEVSNVNWSNAEKWCSAYGQSWRLPTLGELQSLQKKYDTVNACLEKNEYPQLVGFQSYWTSTKASNQGNYERRWAGRLNDRTTNEHRINEKLRARAVKKISSAEIRPTVLLEPIPIQEYNISLSINDNSSPEKTKWEKGDEIFVFLQKLKSTDSEKKYLKLIHDGIRFNVLPNDIDVRELWSLDQSDRRLTAIYYPVSGVQVTNDEENHMILDRYGKRIASAYYLYSDNSDYQFDGTTLTAQLIMKKSSNNIKFYIEGIADPGRYRLSVFNSVGSVVIDKIRNKDLCLFKKDSFDAHNPLIGLSSGNGLVFTGYINDGYAQANSRYIFVLYDLKEDKTYTITRSYCFGNDRFVTLPSDPNSKWVQLEDRKWMDMGTTHKWCFFDYGTCGIVSPEDNHIHYLLDVGITYTFQDVKWYYDKGWNIATDDDWIELRDNCGWKIVKLESDVYGFICTPNSGGESFLFFPASVEQLQSNYRVYSAYWIPPTSYHEAYISWIPGIGLSMSVDNFHSETVNEVFFPIRLIKIDE